MVERLLLFANRLIVLRKSGLVLSVSGDSFPQ